MLILDVQTCWSSTHQMLCRAFKYCNTVDQFVAINKDLHALELSNEDWEAISMVTKWLKTFHSATTQMSTTTKSMLSTTHTIFRGLQDDIKKIITTLPMSTSSELKQGLLDAHRKLSNYYYKYDKSPFYTWAACMSLSFFSPQKVDFTSCYNDEEDAMVTEDELEHYFSLPKENFWTMNPINWWYICSAVAVEHVFSGSRDTISLRQSRLKPDTIRTLMLVKHRLRLA
ncbi:ribonuclease H-like domain-containing protein [Armillaria nabsnona]|nr:ribonuclease H-like domain-containing protein [Armillaria nabsnona]